MLDGMGIGKDGVTILHGGGVYGDKEGTLERIKNTICERLPQNVRERLVLENDEVHFIVVIESSDQVNEPFLALLQR